MPYKDQEKQRASARKWNKAHPDVVAAAVERYRLKIKSAVLSAYGGACARCGSKGELELHHILHDGRQHRQEVGQSIHIYRWAFKNGFPKDRLELLCCSCHMAEHPMERNSLGRFAQPTREAA